MKLAKGIHDYSQQIGDVYENFEKYNATKKKQC